MIVDIAQLNDNLLQLQVLNTPSFYLQCVALASMQLAWSPTGDVDSDELVLLPAGHPPGLYHVICPLAVVLAPAAGIVDRLISFSAPDLGAIITSGVSGSSIGLSLGGMLAMDDSSIVSDGTAPITVKYHPSGVADPCTVNFYAAALMAGRLAAP